MDGQQHGGIRRGEQGILGHGARNTVSSTPVYGRFRLSSVLGSTFMSGDGGDRFCTCRTLAVPPPEAAGRRGYGKCRCSFRQPVLKHGPSTACGGKSHEWLCCLCRLRVRWFLGVVNGSLCRDDRATAIIVIIHHCIHMSRYVNICPGAMSASACQQRSCGAAFSSAIRRRHMIRHSDRRSKCLRRKGLGISALQRAIWRFCGGTGKLF